MSDHHFSEPFPRLPLTGAVLLITLALLGAVLGRHTGLGREKLPDVRVIASAQLRFLDRSDGGIDVIALPGAKPVATVAPGSNGFLRGTLRGLARERMRRGIGAEEPFTLTASADGRLILADPATERSIDLEGFGSSNERAFALLLPHAATEGSAPLVLLGASK
ncbi:MAG: photosynthetic complex assembly protein PuhC [Burkholderiaceae bacterium]|jgi:putative photosynthetic complex assembly protein